MRKSNVGCILVVLMMTQTAATLAQTEAVCPWLTSGSAAKALGGSVTVAAQSTSNWEGSCRFLRRSAEARQQISILIGSLDSHSCPANSESVKALGNQAVQCRRVLANGQKSDSIAGRIRNVFFVVTMIDVPGASQSASADTRPSDSEDASPLEKITEQVVGNLY